MEKTPKFYILQMYDPEALFANAEGCVNIYYVNIEGEDKCWIGYPERATRFKTIGEAMKTAARLSTNGGSMLKVIPIYNEKMFDKK